MTDKEKRELKDGVISIFKRFNILDHTATIGSLRDDILRYIDSLQEEPVSGSRDIFDNCLKSEEKFILPQKISGNIDCENCRYSSACALGDIQACIIDKPVSEDLDEAAWLYYDKNRLPIPPEWDLHKEFIDFFKAGAQWQKSKDESSTEDLEEASKKYSSCIYLEEVLSDDDKEVLKERLMNTFKAGYKFGKEQAEIQIQAQSMALAHGCPKEESVSEDLEKAISTIKLLTSNTALLTFEHGFREGAKWQKKQDQETIELAEDHAMLAGMIKGKEEVIEKTVNFLNWIIGTGNSTIEEYKKYMNN